MTKLPNFLFEVRSIRWEMKDEFGRGSTTTLAHELVAVRVVNPESAKTYIRYDGYDDRKEWMVRIGDGCRVKLVTNFIDYTGGHTWQSDAVYSTDDPSHPTKCRVFIDYKQLGSVKLVINGRPVTVDQARNWFEHLDKWFEV